MFLTADLWPTIWHNFFAYPKLIWKLWGPLLLLSPPHQSVNHNCCSIYERTDCGARWIHQSSKLKPDRTVVFDDKINVYSLRRQRGHGSFAEKAELGQCSD